MAVQYILQSYVKDFKYSKDVGKFKVPKSVTDAKVWSNKLHFTGEYSKMKMQAD